MPRPLHDLKQPQIGPTAGDLGQEAYEANLTDSPGPSEYVAPTGTVRSWEAPEPRNSPPGQKRQGGPAVRMGREARD